jgi:hypothetical protein
MKCKIIGLVILSILLVGCGNRYYHNFADTYEPYRLHLGEPNDTVGARAAGLAGAGRAAADSPAAVVNNPAGLTGLKGLSFEGGLEYENRALRWQADSSYPVAESSTNSFSGSYGGVGLPVVKKRLYVGAAYWTPYNLKLTAGDVSSGGYTESTGAIRSITSGLAVLLGPTALGFSADILWGNQRFNTSVASIDSFNSGFFGYDFRIGFQYKKRFNKGLGFALGAVGRRGAHIDVSNDGLYSMSFVPQVGGGASLFYGSFAFHGDYVYNFTSKMTSEKMADDYVLERIARDAPYYMVGFEYFLGGRNVRGGFAVKPALFRDATRGSVDGRFYSLGGGWKAFGERGYMDVALTYGRRGSINKNRYSTGYIDVILTVKYNL